LKHAGHFVPGVSRIGSKIECSIGKIFHGFLYFSQISWLVSCFCTKTGVSVPDKGAQITDAQARQAKRQSGDSGPGDLEQIDTLRANTYSFLAVLLAAPPAQAVLDQLKQIDATEAESADGSGEMATAWHALKLAGDWITVEALADEYHDLFIGVGRGELVPYGSWYMTGFLMDRPLAFLRQDLKSLGIERQEDVHEPEDHVAALCETMSLIIGSGDEISWDTQRKFFGDHVTPWMGQFFTDLQQAKAARFYRAVGQLGEQFIGLEKQYLAMLA
jgi:TorA maturation chaperone TorD